ncbi:CRP/FNR family cyclic AMP-dependent transcriptional regulator [Bradyrhizobium sp. LM3.2]
MANGAAGFGIMISEDQLKRVAAWARELTEREIEVARAGIDTERFYGTGETVFMRGDTFDYWAGMVFGLARMGGVSRDGKETSLAGLTAGAWFGEGSVLKNEPRRYDVVALRNSRVALMERSAFMWLFENSVGFNRFLVRQLNERLGQFIGMLEVNRTLDATARLARSIASLFNPILYPESTAHLEITQEEIGALSGMSRQNANRALKPAGEGGLAPAGIWRHHHSRYRAVARLRGLAPIGRSVHRPEVGAPADCDRQHCDES